MKILIMPDGNNWVVDRNCRALVKHLPDIEFTIRPYTKISDEDFIKEAEKNDLVHYFNWDLKRHRAALPFIKKPLLMSVRSHRYPPFTQEMYVRPNTWFHVINPDLLKDFPKATYIPNGIFDNIQPTHEFTVGFAGWQSDREYKGIPLIEEACCKLGVKFKPAYNIPPKKMQEYYDSLDVYVCASLAEGFSTPVMECLAMNVPVVTVDTGLPRQFDIVKVERSVEGIMKGIQRFYTQDLVKDYRWDKLAPQYRDLYTKILSQQRVHHSK